VTLRDPARPLFATDFIQEYVVALSGELDSATVVTLDAAIGLLRGSEEDLVLDLTDLSFVDSTGLTRFVRLHRRLTQHGAGLVLRNPRPHLRRILALSGLDLLFRIE
jgi:anti-sigma B factor antagonist